MGEQRKGWMYACIHLPPKASVKLSGKQDDV